VFRRPTADQVVRTRRAGFAEDRGTLCVATIREMITRTTAAVSTRTTPATRTRTTSWRAFRCWSFSGSLGLGG